MEQKVSAALELLQLLALGSEKREFGRADGKRRLRLLHHSLVMQF
jgi:hypothetical protein